MPQGASSTSDLIAFSASTVSVTSMKETSGIDRSMWETKACGIVPGRTRPTCLAPDSCRSFTVARASWSCVAAADLNAAATPMRPTPGVAALPGSVSRQPDMPPRSYDSAFLAQSPQPSVFFLLSQIASAMRSDFDAHLGKIGITVAHMEALLAISKELNLSSADIARRLGVTAQSAGQAVQALEDQKLVRRSPARRNRRVLEISVTPKGYDVLELLARIVGSAEERLLTSIDAEDRLMLKAMLLRILREQRPAVLENWRPLLSSR